MRDRPRLEEVLRCCSTWPGISRASRAVRFADPRAESALESLARLLFARYGLPAPQTQVWLGDDWQAIARAEKIRQERLEEAGYVVVRFTWDDIVYRPKQTIERIRAAFARGAADGSSRHLHRFPA